MVVGVWAGVDGVSCVFASVCAILKTTEAAGKTRLSPITTMTITWANRWAVPLCPVRPRGDRLGLCRGRVGMVLGYGRGIEPVEIAAFCPKFAAGSQQSGLERIIFLTIVPGKARVFRDAPR